MKKVLSVIALSVAFSAMFCEQAFASEPCKDKNCEHVYYGPQKGDFALSFNAVPIVNFIGNMFNGNTDNSLTGFTGSFAGKYFVGDQFAITAGIGAAGGAAAAGTDLLDLVVEIVCGIAGNGDDVRTRAHERLNAVDHGGERRIRAFAEDEFRSVGNGRLAEKNDIQMVLIAKRLCMLGDRFIEIRAGGGTQTAEDSECFCHKYAFLEIWRFRKTPARERRNAWYDQWGFSERPLPGGGSRASGWGSLR